MKRHHIDEFTRGWFIGHFDPVVLKTGAFEVAYKTVRHGHREPKHIHHIATEYSLIVTGQLLVNGRVFNAGEMFIAEPGEAIGARSLANQTGVVVVKAPSVPNDKEVVG